ncbi:MAG: NCS2 family permease, partial [Geodermatophilaceae bacterium]|nr:NCS2 family permease [Geodermatophilaceae bacterium]
FTFSIANGIGAGFIAWVILRATSGRAREVHPLLWATAALFVVYFAIDPLSGLLGV